MNLQLTTSSSGKEALEKSNPNIWPIYPCASSHFSLLFFELSSTSFISTLLGFCFIVLFSLAHSNQIDSLAME